MLCVKHLLAFVLVLCVLPNILEGTKIRIGTKSSPPISFDDSGTWTTSTWEGFNKDMITYFLNNELLSIGNVTVTGYNVTQKSSNTAGFLGLEADEYDIWAASSTKTSDREKIIDFSHTFFKTGMTLLVPVEPPSASVVLDWLGKVFTNRTIYYILIILVVIFGVAVLVWILEMTETDTTTEKYFSTGIVGILQAMGWALNCMSSDSYQKKPRHPIGRTFGVILGRSNLAVVALITALFTAATLSAPVSSSISGVSSLPGHKVACVAGTTAYDWVKAEGNIACVNYASITDAYPGLLDGTIDAVPYDAPRLIWYQKEREKKGKFDVQVVGGFFNPQDYGIGVKTGNNEMREQINRAILTFASSSEYSAAYDKWFKVSVVSNSTQTDYEWTLDAVLGFSITPVVMIMFAVIIRWKFTKTHDSNEVTRMQMKERRLTSIGNKKVTNEDLAHVLSRMVDNQADTLKMTYLLTFRDRFFKDEPVKTTDITALTDKIRESDAVLLNKMDPLNDEQMV